VPIYEFRCETCGHVFEKMMRMSDPTCPACPKPVGEPNAAQVALGEHATACGGETKKLISRGSFHLKGGGWAADGY